MFRKLPRIATLALALVLPLAACEGDLTMAESGELSILLTDLPGDFHRAVVTIDGIYLQADEDAEGEDGRVWLREDAVTTDLLTLANDAMELVESAVVPTGTYGQLRFVISGGFIEVEGEEGETFIYATSEGYAEEHHPDGRSRDGHLQMPSFAQSGLKVNLPGDALEVTGGQRVLLVDFNVAESFGQQAGASGMWVMHPVVHAVDFSLSSSVTVTLALDEGVELPEGVSLGDFAALLDDGEGNVKEDPFEESDGAWTASFSFLLPGETWELSVAPPEGITVETDPALPLDLETVSGSDTGVTVVITGVAEEG